MELGRGPSTRLVNHLGGGPALNYHGIVRNHQPTVSARTNSTLKLPNSTPNFSPAYPPQARALPPFRLHSNYYCATTLHTTHDGFSFESCIRRFGSDCILSFCCLARLLGIIPGPSHRATIQPCSAYEAAELQRRVFSPELVRSRGNHPDRDRWPHGNAYDRFLRRSRIQRSHGQALAPIFATPSVLLTPVDTSPPTEQMALTWTSSQTSLR